MKKILIATHGYLADGIKSSVEILCGKKDEITYINAYVDDTNLDHEIEKFFMNVTPEDKVIILTDILNGSVTQKFIKYLVKDNVFLISGFNLPILLELIFSREEINSEYIEKLLGQSRNQLVYVKELKPEIKRNNKDEIEEFFS